MFSDQIQLCRQRVSAFLSVELKMLSYENIYERVGGDSLAQARPSFSSPRQANSAWRWRPALSLSKLIRSVTQRKLLNLLFTFIQFRGWNRQKRKFNPFYFVAFILNLCPNMSVSPVHDLALGVFVTRLHFSPLWPLILLRVQLSEFIRLFLLSNI